MMFPKDTPRRNKRLLDLARGKPCLLQIPGVCNGDPATTVAAHSNQLIHGKGRGRKAHDCYVVYACADCHFWFDQGPATKYRKIEAFNAAHKRQIDAWKQQAQIPRANSPEKLAALWALGALD